MGTFTVTTVTQFSRPSLTEEAPGASPDPHSHPHPHPQGCSLARFPGTLESWDNQHVALHAGCVSAFPTGQALPG